MKESAAAAAAVAASITAAGSHSHQPPPREAYGRWKVATRFKHPDSTLQPVAVVCFCCCPKQRKFASTCASIHSQRLCWSPLKAGTGARLETSGRWCWLNTFHGFASQFTSWIRTFPAGLFPSDISRPHRRLNVKTANDIQIITLEFWLGYEEAYV